MYYFIVLNLKALLFLYMTQAVHKTWIVFAVTSLISLICFLISYRYLKKHKHFTVFAFYAVFSILMFADVLYCLYFNRLLSITMQSQIKQLPGVGNVISGLINVWLLLFIIDLPFLILYFRKNKSFKMKSLKVSHFKSSVALSVLTIALLFANHSKTIRAYEFFTYHTYDIVTSIREDETKEAPLDIQSLINASKGINGPLTSVAKDRNVIIIQIEALQNLAINLEIQNQEITPNLNSLINETSTIYFDDIYQSVARGNTSDAEFAMLNSLYPSTQQIVYEEAYDKDYYSLAHLLGESGYDTSYFHANVGDFYNREVMTKQLGFDYFYDAEDYFYEDERDIISYGVNDEIFFNQSLEYIEELDKSSPKWMSFLISLSSHAPFVIPEKDKTLFLENEDENIALHYFESLHYMDSVLGEFIDGLKQKGLYDNSMIVIYGDHFGLNASTQEQKEAVEEVLNIEYTVQQMTNVPLLVHMPNTNVKQTISTIGSQVDIYPTVINLLGIENSKGVMLGQDLINSKRHNSATLQFFLPDGSYIDNQFIYVASRDHELDHSVLIDRNDYSILDSSYISNQLEINAARLELSKQLISQNKIKK